MNRPPNKPLFIFDGECSFCRRWVNRWRSITGELVEYEPFQSAAVRFGQISIDNFKRAAQLIDPDGAVTPAPRAVFKILAMARYRRWPLWAYDHLPGFAPLADRGYRFVADHRNLFDKLDMWLIGRHETASTYFLSRWMFLRGLAVVYLIAFISYFVQIDGLIGSKGILPVAPWLDAILQNTETDRYWLVPTLAWINSSDRALHFVCISGIALSGALLAGAMPIVALVLLWVLYLSLVVAGQQFLSFQWDVLLLEAGFLAIFFAPAQLLPRASAEPSPPRIPLWLIRWLAFRIMFLSGLVKLTFGDPTWRNGSALDFHYWSQPLPTWTAWWMHQSPQWIKTFSLLFMYYAELVAPFFIFGPRRIRILAFWSILLLQVMIMATGNYGFFNILTIVLCFVLVDDLFWPGWLRALVRSPTRFVPSTPWRRYLTAPLAVLVILITSMQLIEAWRAEPVNWPPPLAALDQAARPFRSISSYGLFRVMTTQRQEIVIEGSDDGIIWKAYEFKYKPGDVMHRPEFCIPHMPRLDWQMWFAALGNYQTNPWFINFLARLLEGSPPVLELIKTNPFPDRAPRHIRALVYSYRFTTFAERRATGAWWKRELMGLYCPVLSRNSQPWDSHRDALRL